LFFCSQKVGWQSDDRLGQMQRIRPKGVVGGTQGGPRKVLARFAAQLYESFVTTTLRSWDDLRGGEDISVRLALLCSLEPS